MINLVQSNQFGYPIYVEKGGNNITDVRANAMEFEDGDVEAELTAVAFTCRATYQFDVVKDDRYDG